MLICFGLNPSLLEPAWLWIDAICINQADTIEKGIQVYQMDQIYINATIVTVWLGRGSQEVSDALVRIQDPGFLQQLSINIPIPGMIPKPDDPLWQGLRTFFSHR